MTQFPGNQVFSARRPTQTPKNSDTWQKYRSFVIWILCFGLCLAFFWPKKMPSVGEQLENVQLMTPQGESFSLADFEGNWVVLDFWATWCPHCRPALEALNELSDETPGGRPIVRLAINSEGLSNQELQKVWQSRGYNFTVIQDANRRLASRFGIDSLPSQIILDPSGRVAKTSIGAVHSGSAKSRAQNLAHEIDAL